MIDANGASINERNNSFSGNKTLGAPNDKTIDLSNNNYSSSKNLRRNRGERMASKTSHDLLAKDNGSAKPVVRATFPYPYLT